MFKNSVKRLYSQVQRIELFKSGTDRFVNSYLITNDLDQCILIDTGFEEHFEDVKEVIGGRDLKYIIVTHCHLDHCGSVSQLKEFYSANVVLSEYENERLRVGENSDLIPTSREFEEFLETIPSGQVYSPVEGDVILLNDNSSLEIEDFEGVSVMLTPGHTQGSVSVIDRSSRDCFVGDLLYPREGEFKFGRPGFLASEDRFVESVKKLVESKDDIVRIRTGHMEEPINIEDVVRFYDEFI